jgi:hypothetical protein
MQKDLTSRLTPSLLQTPNIRNNIRTRAFRFWPVTYAAPRYITCGRKPRSISPGTQMHTIIPKTQVGQTSR